MKFFLWWAVYWDVVSPRLEILENCNNCAFLHDDIWWELEGLLYSIEWYVFWLLLLLTIFVMFSYKMFLKLWEKWWKSLIPFKNLYCLASLLNVKKISVIWWIVAICRRFLFSILAWWQRIVMLGVIADIPMIVIFFIYDCFVIYTFYCLFRKFGWNKLCSVLWTIFFPIWVCVLWFGNFEYQWEKLEKKGVK